VLFRSSAPARVQEVVQNCGPEAPWALGPVTGQPPAPAPSPVPSPSPTRGCPPPTGPSAQGASGPQFCTTS